MLCPSCGDKMTADRTFQVGASTVRNLVSGCGSRYQSVEIIKLCFNAAGSTPAARRQDAGVTPANTGRALGGRGGSDPLLFPVLLPSDPSQQSGSGRAIRRGRPDKAVYTVEFLILWEAARKQGKCGNKLPAFLSFQSIGADSHLNALILTRFEEWTKTDAWTRGFNPHLSTWLNQRGWEESPTKADITGKPDQPAPTSIKWPWMKDAK